MLQRVDIIPSIPYTNNMKREAPLLYTNTTHEVIMNIDYLSILKDVCISIHGEDAWEYLLEQNKFRTNTRLRRYAIRHTTKELRSDIVGVEYYVEYNNKNINKYNWKNEEELKKSAEESISFVVRNIDIKIPDNKVEELNALLS